MNAISRIEAVTVYSRGALVTRRAVLAGASTSFRVVNLPLAMDDSSVRVRSLEGPAAVDARVILERPGEVSDPLEPAIDEELREVRLLESKALAQVEAVSAELERLLGLEVPARPAPEEGKPPPATPTEARLALLELQHTESSLLVEAHMQAREALRQARERRTEVEARRARASSAREARAQELRKTVVVTLAGSGPGRFELQYLVPGARWAPAYSFRLAPDLTRVDVSVRAQVAQRSGEDWQGVALTLSTANARSFCELPVLESERIGRARPRRPSRWRPPPAGTESLFSDYDRAFPPVAPPPPPQAPRPAKEEARRRATDPLMVTRAGAIAPEAMAAPHMMKTQAIQAPVPAPPASCPAPRSRSLAGGVGAAVEGLFGRRSAPPEDEEDGFAQSAMFATVALGAPRGAAAGPVRGRAPEGALAYDGPDERLLEYGSLRMAPPDGAPRGRLRPMTRGDVYAELCIPLELAGAVDRATAMAEQYVPPPPGCRLVESAGFDYAYRAEHPVDVPADGSFHSVPLTKASGSCRPRYVCVPREASDVFRVVDVESPLSAPLRAGPVDVYIDSTYLLTAHVRDTPGRGLVHLGLGVEQGVKVARNVRFREEPAGLLGGKLALVHAIDVEIANNLRREAVVEIRERVPVAGEYDDDVDVEVGAVSPAWEDWEPDERPLRGGRRWVVAVPAGGRSKVAAEYRVLISSKLELEGGNRREP